MAIPDSSTLELDLVRVTETPAHHRTICGGRPSRYAEVVPMIEVPPTVDPREMFEHLPFPFEGGKFPAQLGGGVQRSVVDAREPAREVIHTDDNSWVIGDGVSDPNLPGAATVLHMRHLLQADPTLEAVATLPLGHVAARQGPGGPWVIVQHVWPEEPWPLVNHGPDQA